MNYSLKGFNKKAKLEKQMTDGLPVPSFVKSGIMH